MFRNYLKTACRNLLKNKVFSLINILGLTIGITVCMMIFLFILNEFSFDTFHKNGKDIYRLMRSYDKSKMAQPFVSGPYAAALRNDYPSEIKQAVRVMPNAGLVTYETTSFNERKLMAVDSGFFKLFSFPLLKGDPASVLSDPNSVVLTEKTAKKYFGSIDEAMNKVITVHKIYHLKVTGIAQNVTTASHLDFDLVMPIYYMDRFDWFHGWVNNMVFTYLQLDEKTSSAALEKRFPQFMDKYMGAEMKKYGFHNDLLLLPLKDIYFEPSSEYDVAKHGDKTVVYVFLSIAVLILLIACINFTNLSTIRAVERSKEVGLRKVLGALRNHLVKQFIGESIILATVSCILAVCLLQLVMPLYNQVLENELVISWSSPALYIFLAVVIIVVGLLAGSYPAFVLSAFSPIQALKGKLRLGKGGSFFRQALVVVQFSISVFLIIGTIVIMNQMRFMKNKQLGYNKDQIVVMPLSNSDILEHLIPFKKELQSKTAVEEVSMMSGEPGGYFDAYAYWVEGQSDKKANILRSEFSDFEFVKTLGLKIIAGRDFSSQYPTDTTSAVLINRTAATTLGFTPEQAIGKWIQHSVRDKNRRYIVGVIEDFNFLSLKENIEPLVIAPNDERRVALIKLKAGNIQSGLAAVKEAYAKAAPLYPFEYFFLDEKFGQIYKKDLRQQTILSVFAGLAIFIACLGLFGLASFTAAKRTKEIGVRKVLGSSTENVVMLLSKDLLKPVIIATLIAIPVSYTVMGNWLQNFAYKTAMHWWIFALAAAITLFIALVTVCIKAIKAAVANPITSLRSE